MAFQILPLPAEPFHHLADLTDAELEARNIDRQTVASFPGTPCRVTLDDAQVGETVYLLNWEHLPEASPYRAAHAIFVRVGHEAFAPKPGELAPCLTRRPISLRGYDAHHRMVEADIAEGEAVADALHAMFKDEAVAYVHLHNAKPGCFAAKAVRA